MKKFTYTYYISKWTIVFLVIGILGGIFTVKGLVQQQQRVHVKNGYYLSKIRIGDCVQYDISFEQLLRRYCKGELYEGYAPVCTTDATTLDNHYYVAIGENKYFYIDLVVPPAFQEEFQQFVDGVIKTYHVYGRIEKAKFPVVYDEFILQGLIYCTGIRDTEELHRMVSGKYQLKVIDPNEKERMWYIGLIFFIMGILGLVGGVEKKDISR